MDVVVFFRPEVSMPKIFMALLVRAQENKHDGCALGMIGALKIINR